MKLRAIGWDGNGKGSVSVLVRKVRGDEVTVTNELLTLDLRGGLYKRGCRQERKYEKRGEAR